LVDDRREHFVELKVQSAATAPEIREAAIVAV
jgi:hypothetical protein